MKKCSTCGIEKDLRSFSKNKSKKDGLSYACKVCNRKYRLANPEKVKAADKKYRLANLEKVREKEKKWRLANLEKVRENEKKWKLANPEKVKENKKKYRLAMCDKYIANLITSNSNLSSDVVIQYPELIEAKRAQIMILRAIKKPKCTTN